MIVSALYSAAEPDRKARRAAILFIVVIFGTIAIIIVLLVFTFSRMDAHP